MVSHWKLVSGWGLKSKFYYADFRRNSPAGKVVDKNHKSRAHKPSRHVEMFATKSVTSPDTNHENTRHKSWKSATWFVSQTFMICVCDGLRRKVSVIEFGLKETEISALEKEPKKFTFSRLYRSVADQLKRDATSTCSLKHVNIVSMYAMIMQPLHYGVVLEFVSGRPLRNFVNQYQVVRETLLLVEWVPYADWHPKQEGAAVEGPPAMGPSLQLSTCVPHNQLSYHIVNIVLPRTQLAAVTLISDPLTLKLVHGVLVSRDPFYQVWYS